MDTFTPRPYRGPSDLQAMIALVSARPPELVTAYPSILDLQELAGSPADQASLWLWEPAGGGLAGFCVLNGSFLAFEPAPSEDFDALAAQMVTWAAGRVKAPAQLSASVEMAEPAVLEAAALDLDQRRMTFLARQGFTAQAEGALHFVRDLEEPVPAPCLPEGFTIRPVAGEEEAEAWVELHRAAHGTEVMTVDYRLAMLRTPEYQPALDLVVVAQDGRAAPDGRLAAYAVCHYSPQENRLAGRLAGSIDPIATHPDFQRRGLARALLLHGMALLKAEGLAIAALTTWSENAAMIRAAQSAGFRQHSRTVFFSRAG